MKGLLQYLGIFIIVLELIVVPLGAQSLSITGYVRNYTGVLLHGENEYSIIQNTLNLNLEQNRDRVAFKVNPYIYQYPNEDLDIGLREAYLDIYFNSFDIRIGKQQIIWGKADGVFITDIISPKDLSEFLLRDFDEIRMGVTGIKADYYINDNTFELVWLPTFTPTLMPPEGSIWRPVRSFPVQPEFDYSRSEVKPSLKNSEVFAKFSAITSLVDIEFMAGYAWDDDPTMHAIKSIDSLTHELTGLIIYPEHHRLTILGGSFSTTLGPFILRGEGAYYRGKYFNSSSTSAFEGVVKKDYLHYLVGIDYTLWNIHMSGQFIQQTILQYEETIDRDEYENMGTFLASSDFLDETLNLQLFVYYGFNNDDALIRPRITYDLADGFEILLGANIFTGSEGWFGQFDNNDMIYSKVKYSF